MRYFLRFVFCLFLLTIFCHPVWAQDSWNIDLLGEIHPFIEQVYDVAGQRVRTLADGQYPAGRQACIF